MIGYLVTLIVGIVLGVVGVTVIYYKNGMLNIGR